MSSVPQKEMRKRTEVKKYIYIKEIMDEFFLYLAEDINLQIQETEGAPNRVNPKTHYS